MLLRLTNRLRTVAINQTRKLSEQLPEKLPYEIVDKELINDDKPLQKSVLEKCDEDLSHFAPNLKPTFNFAAYVNKSKTLQDLVKLGVDLHKIEKKPDNVEYVLRLDFDKDIKNHIVFLSDLGVTTKDIAKVISKNPKIFAEDLDNLQVRINYLESKKFTPEMITRIVSRNPYWLTYSTQEIDDKLGFFQQFFELTGDELRGLAAQQPKLITFSRQHVKVNTFVLKEEMGFTPEETKDIILKKPNILMKNNGVLLKTFEFVHRKMQISLETIHLMPGLLAYRESRFKERHSFLEKLGRVQYNPKEPNYVSPLTLVSGSDAEFCDEIAKTSIQTFNDFLKTL